MASRTHQSAATSLYTYSSKRSLRQEEVAAYRRIGLATLLIVVLLVGGYFLGIPLLARLGSGSSAPVQSSTPINSVDKIPPAAPRLDSLPDAVRVRALTVTGSAESGSTVTIQVNSQNGASTIAGKDGTFSTQVSLKGGDNTIIATAKDTSGNTSKPSKAANVLYDATPPSLTITSPSDSNSTVAQSSIIVSGKTEAEASVTVNDRQVIVQSDGTFSTGYQLAPGANMLTIVAADKAGNIRKDIRNVTYAAQASSSATGQ